MNQACVVGDLKFIGNYIKRRPVTNKHLTCAASGGNVITAQYFYYLGYDVSQFIPTACLMQFCDVLDFLVPLSPRFTEVGGMAEIICLNTNERIFDLFISAHNVNIPLESLLHAAANNGNVSFINKLYSLGVDINHRDADGRTALFDACDGFELEAAELLIDLGIDINAVDNDGLNCLHASCMVDDIGMVKLLLRHRCLSVADDDNNYPEDMTTDEEIKRLVHVEKPSRTLPETTVSPTTMFPEPSLGALMPIWMTEPRQSVVADFLGPTEGNTNEERLKVLSEKLARMKAWEQAQKERRDRG